MGNHLFQYCLARILALNLRFCLPPHPIQGFPATFQEVPGANFSHGPVQYVYQNADLEDVLSDPTRRKIVLCGSFERYRYYRAYKDFIRHDWLQTDIPLEGQVSESDVIIGVRRRDMLYYNSLLPFSYFEEALGRIRYRRVFITSDDFSSPFLRKFNKFDPVFVRTDALKAFRFMMQFKKIIISVSTFQWWSAFLSNAEQIYMPQPMEGLWCRQHQPEIDLWVDDEDRYTLIPCRERYGLTLTETIRYQYKRKFKPYLSRTIVTRIKKIKVFRSIIQSLKAIFG